MHAVTLRGRTDGTIAFAVALALLFGGSAAMTVAPGAAVKLCSGAAFVWMRAPGQSWASAEASFLSMWSAMNVAMMLPSLVPTLWRLRGGAAVELGAGYFLVWTLVGALLFPLGVALAPAMPSSLPGTVLLLAGLFQCSAWKARMLACCRASVPCDGLFLRGVRLGLHCNASCAGATSVLLALGVMDPCTMAAVTAAITAERLAPAGMRVAQVTGVAAIVAGLLLLAS